MSRFRFLPTAFAALLAVTPVVSASGAVFIVNQTQDTADGSCDAVDCSLREAILAANADAAADTVLLPAGTFLLSLAGSSEDAGELGDLDVTAPLSLVGAGARLSIIDGAALDRVFDIHQSAQVELVGVTLRNGKASGDGGGVRVGANATLEARRLSVRDNVATGKGGGLYLGGGAVLVAATLAGNSAVSSGGGIAVAGPGDLVLDNVTIHGNTAGTVGGGIHSADGIGGVLTHVTITGNSATTSGGGIHGDSTPFLALDHLDLTHTLLAGNFAPASPDCSGVVTSSGYNLVGDATTCAAFSPAHDDLEGSTANPIDALLGALGHYGGETDTVVLLAASPAIDAGDVSCTAADQRGVARPDGDACDIGAFEVTNTCVTDADTLCLLDGRFAVEVEFATNQGQGVAQGDTLTDESGTFWFFAADNREVFLKLIDACAQFDRIWFFASGLTNVEVEITVTDTATGLQKVYTNPQNRPFVPVLDTGAFATCN